MSQNDGRHGHDYTNPTSGANSRPEARGVTPVGPRPPHTDGPAAEAPEADALAATMLEPWIASAANFWTRDEIESVHAELDEELHGRFVPSLVREVFEHAEWQLARAKLGASGSVAPGLPSEEPGAQRSQTTATDEPHTCPRCNRLCWCAQ